MPKVLLEGKYLIPNTEGLTVTFPIAATTDIGAYQARVVMEKCLREGWSRIDETSGD